MKTKVYDHKGNCFSSKAEMCRVYNIPWSVFKRRIQSGWDLEKALTAPVRDFIVEDFLGRKFDSITKMSEYYNVSRKSIVKRLERGWPLKEAVIIPDSYDKLFCKEAGLKYDNLKDMFNKLHSCRKEMYYYLDHGYSLDDYIYHCENGIKIKKDITVHRAYIYGIAYQNNILYVGQTIRTIQERYKEHINTALRCPDNKFYQFLSEHIDECTTVELEMLSNVKHEDVDNAEAKWINYYDTYQNGFNSTSGGSGRKLSKVEDINFAEQVLQLWDENYPMTDMENILHTFSYTIKDILFKYRNLTDEDIKKRGMILSKQNRKRKTCFDHLGNKFQSIELMCMYYNIDSALYYKRMNRNWSLERTLTTPKRKSKARYMIYDHLFNVFDSAMEMCEYWKISYIRFMNRIKAGWNLEEALTKPVC